MDREKTVQKRCSKIGFFFLIGTALVYGAEYGAYYLARAIRPEIVENTDLTAMITTCALYFIAMPLLILLLRRIPAVKPERNAMGAGNFFRALLALFAGMIVSNWIGLILTALIGLLKGAAVINPAVEAAANIALPVRVFLYVITAPIVEELVFRKTLCDRLLALGEWPAVLLSGVMFALFHGNLNQFVYAFVLGTAFAYIYIKTGNILLTIGAHMIINFYGSVLSILIITYAPVAIQVAFSVFVYAALIAGIVLIIKNRKKVSVSYGMVSREHRFSEVLKNPGMALYFAFWTVMIIRQLLA